MGRAATGGELRYRGVIFDLWQTLVPFPVESAQRMYRELATQLGASCDDSGDLLVDAHQRTSIEGSYAIGDVVSDINQISVGTGHAAIAATAMAPFTAQRG